MSTVGCRAYYNEVDPYCVQWLRNLIKGGLIADGDVDDRDIRIVQPEDLRGYRQAHFFAGIGGWAYALRLAQWPGAREVWTGSCPCQPFSQAGPRTGFSDDRHLWPAWFALIRKCRPATVFGEQVASEDGLAWLDTVSADMEGENYAFAAADLCAAGIGAPHIRQRLWFVAQRMGDASTPGLPVRQRAPVVGEGWRQEGRATEQPGRASGGLADLHQVGRSRLGGCGQVGAAQCGEVGGVADNTGLGCTERRENYATQECDGAIRNDRASTGQSDPCPTDGFWRDADWLLCRDGKWRPVEPGTFPLAHGIPGRVGQLRAFGNAIVPQVAAEVIRAFLECRP